MAAVEAEVGELVGGQLTAVDRGWSTHDQLDGRAVDEHADGLGTGHAAVAALDVLCLHDELASDVTRQYVRARALRSINQQLRVVHTSTSFA